jgi:hypothetical protein
MTQKTTVDEDLYRLNAWISLNFIGLKKKPTLENMITINGSIGNIIKKYREDNK